MLTRNSLGSLLGLSALLMSVWPFAAQAADIHVPADQPTIQAGINAASTGDVVIIANGTYTGTGNKNLSFNGKAITVRSESNDPTLCIIDCQGSEGGFNFMSGETAASILSGITIQNGVPTTTGLVTPGKGIFCVNSSPTITNCVLAGNNAPGDMGAGGAMYLQNSNSRITNCVFIGNSAGLKAGGVFNNDFNPFGNPYSGSPTFINCTFTQNSVPATLSTGQPAIGGGAMYNDYCSPTLINCVFTGNSAGANNAAGVANANGSSPIVTNCLFLGNTGPGGISNNTNCSPTVTNCLFVGNTDGMLNVFNSNPTLTNCTFTGNGIGILNQPSSGQIPPSNPILTNCILRGDAGGEVVNPGGGAPSHPVITYSDVQGGYSGTGNLNADPLFVRAPSPGPDGVWGAADDDYGDLHLQAGSPVINVGNNAVVTVPPFPADGSGNPIDLDGNPRISHGIVDMGAYELQIQNLAPVTNAGQNQTVTVPHDGDPNTNTISFTLDGSASFDPNGDTLTFQWTDQNNQVIGSSAKLTLTRSPGTYLFTLTTTDPLGASSSASVQVTVQPEPNQPPVANSQSVSTNENTPTSLTLSGSDPDGDAFSYQVTGQPQHGFLFGTAPNLIYIPDNDYNGSDTISFTTTDSYGAIGTGTINITVVHINQPPVAYSAGFSTATNKALSIGLAASDPDGDPLTYTIVSGPSHGKLTGTGATRTYKPASGFNGTDTFTFKVNDGQYDSNVATVTITVSPLNHPPKAVKDTATTTKGVAVTINVLANDSDPDGDPLSVQSITQPANGTTVLNADGTVTYTPSATFKGKDTFQYTISDGRGGTDTANVAVTVTK